MSVEDLIGQNNPALLRSQVMGLQPKPGFWQKVAGVTEVNEPIPRTLTGKVIRGGEYLLGGLSDLFQRGVTLPIAEKLYEGDPLISARLEALKSSYHPLFLSDVTSQTGLLEPTPDETFASGTGKFVGRLAQDIVGDPLSYVGIGLPTKLGRVSRAVTGAKEIGQSVKLDSKIARQAAELFGAERPSAQLIKNVPKSLEGRPISEQMAGGQRSLLSLDVPGTDVNIPLPVLGTGKVAQAAVKPFEAISRLGLVDRYTNAARELFSNKTGTPEFDKLVEQYRDLALYRSGEKIIEAKQLNNTLDDLTRQLGMDRKTLNRTVSTLVERETAGLPARGIIKAISKLPTLEEHLGPIDIAALAFRNEGLHPDTSPELVINKIKAYYTPKGSEVLAQELNDQLEFLKTAYTEPGKTNMTLGGDLDFDEFGYFPKATLDTYRQAIFKLSKGNSISSLTEKEADAIRELNFGDPRPLDSIGDVGTPLDLILGEEGMGGLEKSIEASRYRENIGKINKYLETQLPLSREIVKDYISPQLHLDVVDPQVAKVARDISEKQLRQLITEQTSGVRVVPLVSDREYLPHIITPEALDSMREATLASGKFPKRIQTKEMDSKLINAARREFVTIKPEVVDQWVKDNLINSRKAGALKGKDGLEYLDNLLDDGVITEDQFTSAIHTLSIEEVNDIARNQGLKILGVDHYEVKNGQKVPIYRKIDEFFQTDPVYSTGVRGVRGERARTSAEFFQELKERGIATEAPLAPDHFIPVKQPELQGYKFEPEIANALNKWYHFISVPQSNNAFLKLFDKTQDWWKAWTLAIFPAYHTRNIVGNLWNNYLAGVINPKFYYQAGKIATGNKVTFRDGLGKIWNTQSVVEEAKKLGVIDRGWYGGDIATRIEEELSSGKLFELGRKNALVKAGFKIGRYFENNARMAHFISKLDEGLTPAEAAFSVKKYLFDYGDLSDVEKSVMKRLFPFYTWTRKNVPLQLEHLITDPWKFSVIYKAQREAERPTDQYQLKYLPQWMMENFPTRVRYNKDTKTFEYFLLNSWLPAADLTKIFKLHEVAANMLSPIPKEILQQAFNYDFFLKKKIEEIPGQKQVFLGQNLPSRFVHGAKIIRLLNEVDKMTSEDQSLWSKIGGLITGKTYTVDPDKAFMSNKIELDAKLDDVKKAIKREARKSNPDKKEMARLINLMNELSKQY